MRKSFLIIIITSLLFSNIKITKGQYIPLNNDFYNKATSSKLQEIDPQIWGMKPFLIQSVDSVDVLKDDIYSFHKKTDDKSVFFKKVYTENLLKYKTNNVEITLDPLFDFTIGKEDNVSKLPWRNTRAIDVTGNLFDKVFFNTQIFETQSFQPSWVKNFADSLNVIPGQGPFKRFKNQGFDYYNSSAYLVYMPSKHFYFTAGYGKNFIGEGYRSVILSDISHNYPYIRLDASFENFKYTVLYSNHTEIETPIKPYLGYDRKWSAMHYLQVRLWKKLHIGLFDAVVWGNSSEEGYRGFDFQYLNPVLFLRPAEFSLGSPDNYMIGTTVSYHFNNNYSVYSQFLLDEFHLKNILKNDGWWANKYAIQLGVSGKNILKINGLFAKIEFNQARPYTFSHSNSLNSYSHANQSLTHPLGANFREGVFLATYRFNNWETSLKFVNAMYGADTSGVSYGQNILISYREHPFEYGNFIGQGVKTNLSYFDFRVAYLLNRKTNMKLETGLIIRNQKSELLKQQNILFSIGFRTNLHNFYYDF